MTNRRTTENVFYEYAARFDWEFSAMADVQVAFLGETILDNLLAFIEEVGLTEDFEEFLMDNWQDEPTEARDLIEAEQIEANVDWVREGF